MEPLCSVKSVRSPQATTTLRCGFSHNLRKRKVHGKRVLKKRTTMIEYQIPFDNPLRTIGVHKGTFIEKSERDEGARFSSNDCLSEIL